MATYRQRGKKKTWDYRIFDKNKKLIASGSGFKTKKEAVYEAQAIEQKIASGSVFQTSATLYEMFLEWYELIIVPSKLVDATKEKYWARGKRLQEYFNDKPANKITHSEYQAFINAYCKKALKNHVYRLNKMIRDILAMAIRDGALINDFTEGVRISGEKHRKQAEEKYIHSVEDLRRILVLLKDKMDYRKSVTPYLLYLYFTTGFRPGEGAAVCWEDIDFDKSVIRTYRRYFSDTKQFTAAKTKWSEREIPVSTDLLFVLKKLQGEQERELQDRGLSNPEGLVFFDYRYGVPTSNAVNKYLRKILQELELPTTMSVTGTRHTYASYLLSKKVDIWVVSKILGHKDIQQLMETYGHLLKEVEQEEYDHIRSYLKL